MFYFDIKLNKFFTLRHVMEDMGIDSVTNHSTTSFGQSEARFSVATY